MRYGLGEKIMKQIMLILGTVIFSTAAAFASADDAKSAKSKIEKWQDRFVNQCQNQYERKSNTKYSKDYCLCIVDSHRDYILGKIKDGDEIDVDQHLKELLDLYQPSSSDTDDEDGEPSIFDIDVEFSKKCLEKQKGLKARATPAKKK